MARGTGFIGLIALGLLVGAAPAWSASRSFGPFSVEDAASAIILLDGEITPRSALDFRRVLEAAPNARALALNSPGGDTTAALLIADDVHTRSMRTLIPKGAECHSACAYIFLAGAERSALGELGVHQVSGPEDDMASAQTAIADVIDFLVRFGTPPDVLSIMFRTPPEEMHVFSADEIARFGIERTSAQPTTSLPGQPARESEAAAKAADEAARKAADEARQAAEAAAARAAADANVIAAAKAKADAEAEAKANAEAMRRAQGPAEALSAALGAIESLVHLRRRARKKLRMRLGGAAVIEHAAAGERDEIAGAARFGDLVAEALIGVAGRRQPAPRGSLP